MCGYVGYNNQRPETEAKTTTMTINKNKQNEQNVAKNL